MDFVGQKHYEFAATLLYLTEGLVCFVIGFALKDFEMMVKIFFAGASMGACGLLVTCAACANFIDIYIFTDEPLAHYSIVRFLLQLVR